MLDVALPFLVMSGCLTELSRSRVAGLLASDIVSTFSFIVGLRYDDAPLSFSIIYKDTTTKVIIDSVAV